MSAALLLRGPHAIVTERYGAAELKASSERNMSLAALLAAALVCLSTPAAVTVVRLMPHPVVVKVPGHRVIDIFFPADPRPTVLPQPHLATPRLRPPVVGRVGVLDPRPDALLKHVPNVPDAIPGTDPGTTLHEPGQGPGGGPGAVPGTQPDPGTPGGYVYRDKDPEVLSSPIPRYPDLARENHIEGRVVLWAWVGTDGRVSRVDVRQGVPTLDEAAIEAVRRWTFIPAQVDGRPVAVWVAVPVLFSLEGSR